MMSRGLYRAIGAQRSAWLGAIAAIIATSVAAAAQAATVIVTNANDSGRGSLRQAIVAAHNGDTIAFNLGGTPTFTIVLQSTLPTIAKNLTITGPDPSSSATVTISGNNAEQILEVGPTGTLTLQYLTLADGFVGGQSPFGGAIENQGTLNIANCTFSGNEANGTEDAKSAFGGAIDNTNRGTVTIVGSTFSENVVTGGTNGVGIGGAISDSVGIVTITNSTFSANSAAGGSNSRGEGGAVAIGGASGMTLTNVTFAGNIAVNGDGSPGRGGAIESSGGKAQSKGIILADSTGGNCFGALDDQGYNISDDDSCNFTMATSQIITPTSLIGLAAAPAENGGPTDTIALISTTSVANTFIPAAQCTDQSDPPKKLTTDQRGYGRPVNGTCSAGAFQYGATPLIDCSKAMASNPNLTALIPLFFFPEYIYGVSDPSGGYGLKITGVTQDKLVPRFPLCPNAFWIGTTTFVRTNNQPQQGPGGLLYSIDFTATDNATGVSCTGAVPVCVQARSQKGEACLAPIGKAYDATKCP